MLQSSGVAGYADQIAQRRRADTEPQQVGSPAMSWPYAPSPLHGVDLPSHATANTGPYSSSLAQRFLARTRFVPRKHTPLRDFLWLFDSRNLAPVERKTHNKNKVGP